MLCVKPTRNRGSIFKFINFVYLPDLSYIKRIVIGDIGKIESQRIQIRNWKLYCNRIESSLFNSNYYKKFVAGQLSIDSPIYVLVRWHLHNSMMSNEHDSQMRSLCFSHRLSRHVPSCMCRMWYPCAERLLECFQTKEHLWRRSLVVANSTFAQCADAL